MRVGDRSLGAAFEKLGHHTCIVRNGGDFGRRELAACHPFEMAAGIDGDDDSSPIEVGGTCSANFLNDRDGATHGDRQTEGDR